MGSDSFFSKIASADPLAHALNLPGANKYTASQASHDAQNAATTGPYAGKVATLAGANAGYLPGGPGSDQGWHQPVLPSHGGGFFGTMQSVAANTPSIAPTSNLGPGGMTPGAQMGGGVPRAVVAGAIPSYQAPGTPPPLGAAFTPNQRPMARTNVGGF